MKDVMISIKSVSNGWIMNIIDGKTQQPLHDSTMVFTSLKALADALDDIYTEEEEDAHD